MLKVRRLGPPKKTKAAIKDFRAVLRGLYFRHEFARRNPEVVKASETLFKEFGWRPSSGKRFLLADRQRLMPLELLQILNSSHPKRARRLRSLLARFFLDFKVLPVGRMKRPFFPEDVASQGADLHLLIRFWNAILRVEAYAISVLGLGHPIMFPVMTLGKIVQRDTEYPVYEQIDLSRYSLPLLVDHNAPLRTITAYMDAFRIQERTTSNISGNIKEIKRTERLPWTDFPTFLKAFDLEKTLNPRSRSISYGGKTNYQVDFVEQLTGIPAKLEKDRDTARHKYISWQEHAAHWISNYAEII